MTLGVGTAFLVVIIVSVGGVFSAANLTFAFASGLFHNRSYICIWDFKSRNRQPEEDAGSEENDFLMKFFEEKAEKLRYRAKRRKYRRKFMDKLVQRFSDK